MRKGSILVVDDEAEIREGLEALLSSEGFDVTNPAEAQKAATESYRRRIAHGIAQGILEEHKLGDAGIAPVPQISAPMSEGADKYQSRIKGSHRRSRNKN